MFAEFRQGSLVPPSVCPESARDSLVLYNHVFFSDFGASCGHSKIGFFNLQKDLAF